MEKEKERDHLSVNFRQFLMLHYIDSTGYDNLIDQMKNVPITVIFQSTLPATFHAIPW